MTSPTLRSRLAIRVQSIAMDLLKAMLEKEPKNRISARDALSHPAFETVMSKSPLITRQLFNSDALLRHSKMVEQWA